MAAVGVIPARFAASRFPGKPLARIAGVPTAARASPSARTTVAFTAISKPPFVATST